MPPAPERRRGGAGVRCGRTGRTPRRLVPSGGRPVAGAVTAGGPPSWPACAVGRLRRTAIRTLSAGDRGRAAAEARDAERRLGVLMEGSQGSPGKGRPLARPAVGSSAAVAELRPPLALFCLRRFWLLSFGLYVSAPARLAPPSSGPAVQEMSLRRSFVADFLREFPAPCPAGRQASVGHSSASFASSQKQRGERGRWPVT